jgi:GAF domain-containing protein
VVALSPEVAGRRAGFPAELAGALLIDETTSGVLDLLVQLATSTVAGVDAASISRLVGTPGRIETSTAGSTAIRAVDEAQHDDDAGPCVEAIRHGREVAVTLPSESWLTFSERAQQAGMSAVLSLPLRVRDHTTGALNLCSRGEAVGGPAVDVARALAAQAGVVLANAAALRSAERTKRHLEEALMNRDLIGQAESILMGRQDISADAAFDVLVKASQRTGRKLRDIASDLASRPGQPASS